MQKYQEDQRLLKIGEKIGDVYEVETFLGEGAFAEVYRVRHRFLGRQAMKVFKRTNITIEETEEMLSEAILLSRIGHPNIVRVFNADILKTQRGLCGFFTMEYVAGGTLDRYWRSFGQGFIPLDQTVEVVKQICQGLVVAHSASPPIIHRDIKPQNILVGYDGAGICLRLSDFGLAKRVNPMTLIASARGTLAFKAPEFLERQDSTRSDIWAVGMTMYLLLTDQLPYADTDEAEFISGRHWKRPIIPPSGLNIDVDPTLDSITMKALAMKPEDRYKDAQEMLVALSYWQKSEPVVEKGSVPYLSSVKTALGDGTPLDRAKADNMVESAFKVACEPGRLMEAADLLEEAMNAAPEFRNQYEYQLLLWRKGISM
jgi:serine/threonine protein kinase